MFLIRTKKSFFYWYKPSKGLEQSFYRFGTFQFTMERLHFIVEHLTFYIGTKQFFYGTKGITALNVLIYNWNKLELKYIFFVTKAFYFGTFEILLLHLNAAIQNRYASW